MMAYRDLLYLRNVLYLNGGMMAEPLWTDQYLEFFFDEGHKNHVVVAKKMRDEYEARLALAADQIERLRAELEAEQARTICAMCGEELTRMAKL